MESPTTSKINQASVKQDCMIIVDCKDVEPILNELAIYVSDQVAAVPALKAHQFVLSPIEDDEQINQSEVIASIKEYLDDKTFKLYELIWERAVASQMNPAIVERTTIDINTSDDYYTLRASGGIIKFDGFLRVVSDQLEETILPRLEEGTNMLLEQVTSKQHFTEPPARYSDGSIVKELEEYGIGRPST